MDYLTVIRTATEHLATASPDDPAVRAALDLAVKPWLDGIHGDVDMMRWGSFAVAVQNVTAELWPGPAGLILAAEPAIAGSELDAAAAQLAIAAADMFTRAAGEAEGETQAWRYSAAAAQLHRAAGELK